MSANQKFEKLENVRVTVWANNKPGSFNHFDNQSRPIGSPCIEIPADAEPVTLEPGKTYYLPGIWCRGQESQTQGFFTLTFPVNTKQPMFSGGVKTK